MDSDQIKATVILTIEAAELHQTVNQSTSLVVKGPLNILYLATHNCFMIQIKSFNYHLSKEIPILASPGKGSNAYPSYVLPLCEGFYVIKITKASSIEALSSFETILSNHSDLAYKTEDEQDERPDQALIQTKGGEPEEKEKKRKTQVASNIIYKGGDLTRTGLIYSAEAISKGISKIGDFVQRKYIKKNDTEKEVNESTINKLKLANTTTGAFLTFTQAQVTAIMTVGKAIGKEVGTSMGKTEAAKKFENYKHHDTIVEIGKSTLNAFASIYDGMTEALYIVGRGIGQTTTKVVTHKYGEQVGNATHEGFEAVGNIGKVTRAFQVGAAQAVGDVTAKKENEKSR